MPQSSVLLRPSRPALPLALLALAGGRTACGGWEDDAVPATTSSSSSPSSQLPGLLDEVVPALAAAADGDPSTAVPTLD